MLALGLLLALTACTPAPVIKPCPPIQPPAVVAKYVAVPDVLTAPLAVPERDSNTVPDVVKAYNLRGDALRQCNQRLDAIRALGEPL